MRERLHYARGGAGTPSTDLLGEGWPERGAEGGFARHHAVLEDDAADDDGDGGGELADETERGSCGGDVAGLDEGLECDQWGLEVGADA